MVNFKHELKLVSNFYELSFILTVHVLLQTINCITMYTIDIAYNALTFIHVTIKVCTLYTVLDLFL